MDGNLSMNSEFENMSEKGMEHQIKSKKLILNENLHDVALLSEITEWHKGFIYRAMDTYADTYASELKQENERLRGLLEHVFKTRHNSFYRAVSTMTAKEIMDQCETRWQQFAADNNINPSA